MRRNADRFWMHGVNPVKGPIRPPGMGVPSFNKYAKVSPAYVSAEKRERLRKRRARQLGVQYA